MAKIINFAILCSALVFGGVSSQNFTTVIQVPELGEIQGNAANTARDVRPYWVFHGIPYADISSYTGEKRFQPSELFTGPLTEDGTPFIANRIRVMCPQPALFEIPIQSSEADDLASIYKASRNSRRSRIQSFRKSKSLKNEEIPKSWGVEECLVLNVNTPKLPTEEDKDLLPVIIYIHGGGSTAFWGSIFTGLRLMEKDVVLVTLNYRLGALGALDFGLNEAPGAQALYDAVVALKWVQRHIEHFGGDPNRVTLTGQSAGSMMTTHLMISPLAKGLFHNVWGFSGSALNVWGTTASPSINHHLDVAYYAGCFDRDTTPPADADLPAIVACMAAKPYDDLVDAVTKYEFQEVSIGRLGFDAVVTRVQSPDLTIPRFIAEEPAQILKEGRHNVLPLVLGATRHDGSFVIDDIYNDYLLPEGLIHNETFVRNDMIPQMLKTFGIVDSSGGLQHSLAYSYLGDYAITVDFDSKIPGLIDIATVFGFKGGMYKMLEYNAKFEPRSYFYSFDYKGRWTVYGFLGTYIPGGRAHVDDMFYLFYLGPLLNDDMKVSRRMVDYLVNFAYTGNPTPPEPERLDEVTWAPFDNMDHKYLVINRVDKVALQTPDSWIGASEELVERSKSPVHKK